MNENLPTNLDAELLDLVDKHHVEQLVIDAYRAGHHAGGLALPLDPARREPYPVATIRYLVDNTGTFLTVWACRDDVPDAARTAASNAVEAIDETIKRLHQLRSNVINETLAWDDDRDRRKRD